MMHCGTWKRMGRQLSDILDAEMNWHYSLLIIQPGYTAKPKDAYLLPDGVYKYFWRGIQDE